MQQLAGSVTGTPQLGSATVMPHPGSAAVPLQLESTAFMSQQKTSETLHTGLQEQEQEQDPDKLLEKFSAISIKDMGKVARSLAHFSFAGGFQQQFEL